MTSLIETFAVDFTDTPERALMPKLIKYDPVESSGTLLLIDPTHPLTPWASGVPSGAVPNLAAETASTITGANASTAATFSTAGLTATVGKFERSGKGGLHGIISQVNNTASGQYGALAFEDWLRTYFLNNQSHSFYFSIWQRITRAGGTVTTTAPPYAGIFRNPSGASNAKVLMDTAGTKSTAMQSQSNQPGPNTIGPTYRSAAVGAYTGSSITTLANVVAEAVWGTKPNGTSNLAAAFNIQPSWILYRVTLEDLTVSGRTFAEVNSIDYAEYQKHVIAGRFSGDTFTSPATIA